MLKSRLKCYLVPNHRADYKLCILIKMVGHDEEGINCHTQSGDRDLLPLSSDKAMQAIPI